MGEDMEEGDDEDNMEGASPVAPVAAPRADRPADVPKAPREQVLAKVEKEPAAPQKPPPQEEKEQIVVVPTRSRVQLEATLGLDDPSLDAAQRTDPISDASLRELKKIYETSIKPLELLYKYEDISNRHISDAELFAPPMILVLGPYSTGKSTFINYLLGNENTKRALKTGMPPSLGAFRVVQYG